MTHICVGNLTIIGSDSGLSSDRRQAIIWTNDGILLIRTLGTNFSEILSEIHSFSFKKMHLKMSSAKWRLFRLGLNVLNNSSAAIQNKVTPKWYWLLNLVENVIWSANNIQSSKNKTDFENLISYGIWHPNVSIDTLSKPLLYECGFSQNFSICFPQKRDRDGTCSYRQLRGISHGVLIRVNGRTLIWFQWNVFQLRQKLPCSPITHWKVATMQLWARVM